ncbi:oligosaccharide flippase family protein [Tsukamurella sp. 8F]|uniref:lipopolysaccharide biosynthesis protein n=1 Tax=unclassified Tsukamurella TaxID=2633480 RepID=UPI0023B942F1|nr:MULTISPECIES: oligosaccharide flippase family protein [unclassified Tsukamurella]MDF0530652.1 oligosaccharide flippase family protein [Tsukamurella sp. 8J]MDF0587853.1 oligosaccharide flippase family protein [Tsukamurella sp. 8F]
MAGPGRIQSLRVGALAQILPLATGYGANLLATPFFVSQLGLHDFGIWAVTGAIAQYAGLFDLGVSRANTRYVALYHAQGRRDLEASVLGLSLGILGLVGTIIVLIPLVASDVIASALHTPDHHLARDVAVAAAVVLVVGLISRALVGAAFGRGRQVAGNVGLAAMSLLQIGGGIVGLTTGQGGLERFAIGTASGALVGSVAVVGALLLDERTIPIGNPVRIPAREILAFGIRGQVSGAADVITMQSGKILAGLTAGPTAAGAYELGSRLALGAQAFGGAAAVAMNTHLTHAFAASGLAGIRADYRRLTTRNAATAMFLPLLLVATGPFIVPLWLGQSMPTTTAVVCALGLAIAVNVSTGVCSAAAFAAGRTSAIAIAASCEAIAALAAAVPAGLAFGFPGIVAGLALVIAVGNVLSVAYLQRGLGIPFSWYLRAVAGPACAGGTAVLCSLVVWTSAIPADRGAALLPCVITTCLFTAVYLGISWYRGYLPRFGHASRSPGAGSDTNDAPRL